MSGLAHLIWPAYLVASIIVFSFSVQNECSPWARMESYMLGLSLMCLGVGRMQFAFDPLGLPGYQWIFDIAHCAMLSFVAIKIRNLAKERAAS